MTWSRAHIILTCGCDGYGRFEDVDPGDEQTCQAHGTVRVARVMRVRDA